MSFTIKTIGLLVTRRICPMIRSTVQLHASSSQQTKTANGSPTNCETVDYEYIEENSSNSKKVDKDTKSTIQNQDGRQSVGKMETKPLRKITDSRAELVSVSMEENIATKLISKGSLPPKSVTKSTVKKPKQVKNAELKTKELKQAKKTRKTATESMTKKKQSDQISKNLGSSGYEFMNQDVIEREEHCGIHDASMTTEEIKLWMDIDKAFIKKCWKLKQFGNPKGKVTVSSLDSSSKPLKGEDTTSSQAQNILESNTTMPGNSSHTTLPKEADNLCDITDILTFPLCPITKAENKNLSQGVTTVPDIIIPGFTDVLPDVHYPSVSKILNVTMPPEQRFLLDRWEKKMIAEMGYERFQEYREETFAKGRNFHTCVEEKLGGKVDSMIEVLEANRGHWSSIQSVFPDIHQVELVEHRVQHPHLYYQGVFDCIAKYKQTLCVIDWKTSKKVKSSLRWTYDNPVQLAAYMGAINYDQSCDLQVENALLVIAYQDGQKAHAHFMPTHTCMEYWNIWLQRVYKYWHKFLQNKVIQPPKTGVNRREEESEKIVQEKY